MPAKHLPASQFAAPVVPAAPPADVAGAPVHIDLGRLPAWDLSDLYPGPDAPALAHDLGAAAAGARALAERYRGRLAALGSDGPALAEAIGAYERLSELVGRLAAYASLHFYADMADPARAKLHGDVQERLATVTGEVVFFELELNRIEAADLAKALATPELARYAPWLADLAREKPHQIDERLEQLFIEKSTTSRAAFERLFDETMATLRFAVAGEAGPLTLEPTLNLLFHPDRARRRAAAAAAGTVFAGNIRLFTLITNTLAKDKEISDRWHGFADVAASRHLANRVEHEVVEALVGAVRAAYPRTAHRYYALKARWLGLERLADYDRNAPLPECAERLVPWSEAERLVLDAYAGFAPEMAAVAGRFFERRWIDAATRPGKAPGAFSHPTVPSAHPYVLLNYQGRTRDVMTLAHELGHGVHQVLAARQGALLAPTPLTLAETASVFGEMLTFRAIVARTPSRHERKALIARKVEDMLNTVVRQIAFHGFERRVHEARRAGELSADEIGRFWLEVQQESLGPAFRFEPGYATYWCYVPHFVRSPFYVYAYAFGDCLVGSLYGLYEEAHPGFVGKYLDMLAAGGSKHHSELLAPFGLDARDPGFWSKGLGVIERMIDELEAMEGAP